MKEENMKRSIQIRDLKQFISHRQMSPEKFAAEVGLSHMTIRRWLKKPDHTKLDEKYRAILGPKLGMPDCRSQSGAFSEFEAMQTLKTLDVEKMMKEIEESGKNFTDIKTLDQDVTQKLKSSRLDKIFADYCKRLVKAAKSAETPVHAKAIAIGALLYFVNPIDLIPDSIPVVGFLDDLAILSIALNYLRGFAK